MLPDDGPDRYFRFGVTSGWNAVEARVITETTVSLTVNGESWLSFTCTPARLDALAVGFLFNEGILNKLDEIAAIDVCKQGANVDVWLDHAVERPQNWQRTSGCTGGFTAVSGHKAASSLTAVKDSRLAPGSLPGERIAPEMLLSCMEQLTQTQELYREAGGVHCSALSDGREIRYQAEDIGRHNTLDKLAGEMLLNGMQFRPTILATTGRVSSEMLQKSARMGATIVVSRTSATSQSVAAAELAGITLVGYARRNGFLVYSHPERMLAEHFPSAAPVPLRGETPQGC